jgi:hypothetical protein
MASAVLAPMALTAALPDAERVGPQWMLPFIEGLLLVAVVVGDPGKIDRRSRTLRALSIGLVSVLVFGALWSTVQLIDDLIHGELGKRAPRSGIRRLDAEHHRVRPLLGA